jgi:hypothetical protein
LTSGRIGVQTCFEHFAATSMLGSEDAPPRCNGSLAFSQAWERRAYHRWLDALERVMPRAGVVAQEQLAAITQARLP